MRRIGESQDLDRRQSDELQTDFRNIPEKLTSFRQQLSNFGETAFVMLISLFGV